MIQQLPENANLEHLKGQAKTLLQSLRSGDLPALDRIGDLPARPPYRLADAQLVIAREYGFTSWAQLKRHLIGYTDRRDALFAAIRAGDRDRVLVLLDQYPALVRSRDPHSFGSTVLNEAARRDDQQMIDLLLDHGADIEARSDWSLGSFGPLDFADDRTTTHLLSRGAKLTAHAAARLGWAEELRKIISSDPEVVRERGGDGQYPLHFAKTPEIVDILLDAGADIDARDLDHEGTPLQNRIKNEPVARRLWERGATPDVFSAAVLGEVSVLEHLLDEDPAAISRRTSEPGNPWIPSAPGRHIYLYEIGAVQLHQVASHFEQKAVYELLWERSNPALRLTMAAWRGDRDAALQVVEDNPGLIATLSEDDMQMLPDAAWNRQIDTVKLLLEVGFDVNTVNSEKMGAAHNGAFHGFDDVVEAILAYQPDLTLRNAYGGNPIGTCIYGSMNDWRKDGNHARCVELLLEAGSPLPDRFAGTPEVKAVLEQHGMRNDP